MNETERGTYVVEAHDGPVDGLAEVVQLLHLDRALEGVVLYTTINPVL